MKHAWKWAAIILGIIVVLGLTALPFLLRSGDAAQWMHPGVDGWGRMGGHAVPRMMGGFGLIGGGLLLYLLRFLGQLAIFGLVIAGAVSLVKALRAPQSQSAAPAPAPAPVQAATCTACGKALQSDWAHCPYCGEKI